MDVQKLVRVQIIVLLVGIQLTLFAGIGCCTHASPSEGEICYDSALCPGQQRTMVSQRQVSVEPSGLLPIKANLRLAHLRCLLCFCMPLLSMLCIFHSDREFVLRRGKCYSNSDVETHTRSGLPCLEKYISEPYFVKHGSSVDSSFDNFIANELPLGLCGVLPEKLNRILGQSIMQRYLIGEGSHRRLSSSIKLSGPLESIAELPRHMCKAIIIEKLPSGIFADPFELQHLLQRGVFADAAVFGDTNLELPSVVSNRSIVEVQMSVDYNTVSGQNNGLKINVEVPLHARYQPLGERGFAMVEFSRPDIFLRCNIDKKSQDNSCLFTLTGTSDESKTVVWEIPCGVKQHSGVVSVVTFVSAVVAAFLIVLTSIYYPHYQKSRVI